MTGREEYEFKKQRKIDNLLSKHPAYLSSYHGFISMNKSYDTRYNYLLTIVDFMNKTRKGIKDLNMDDFTVYLANIVSTKSSSYGIRAHAALKLFGKYLYASHHLSYNPMEYVERPKYKETNEMIKKREIGFLDKDEIQQLKQNVLTGVGNKYAVGRQDPFKYRDMLIILMFLSTGMRCSALTRIDIKDVDVEKSKVYVYDKGDKPYEFKLPTEVMEYYDRWIRTRKQMFPNVQTDALFIGRTGNRIPSGNVADIVKKYSANIKGKHITPHKLRATFGTQLYNATGDIYFTQQCMHHNSPKTTELYIRGQKANTDKAADIMANIFG